MPNPNRAQLDRSRKYTKRLSVDVTPEMAAELKALSKLTARTHTEAMREAIENWLWTAKAFALRDFVETKGIKP